MESDRALLDQFSVHFARINEELEGCLGTGIPIMREISRYSLLGKGKRLRPLLFVLASHLCGYTRDEAYRISTIFEIIHAASLMHDDVMDNAETRRKKASVRHVWGNPAAVLGGDFLYAKAAGVALGSGNLSLCAALNDASARMVEGQFLELTHTHNWQIRKEDYMEIIASKTGALMSAACACGGILSGADQETVDCLGRFGLNLGVAFQLVDDLLDYTATQEEFGKPVGKDLKEGKITLPLIYTLASLDRGEAERLQALFQGNQAEDKDYQRLTALVRENGAVPRIRAEAAECADHAARWLDGFPPSSPREGLMEINAYIVRRTF